MFMVKLKIFLDLWVNLIHEDLMHFTPTPKNAERPWETVERTEGMSFKVS